MLAVLCLVQPCGKALNDVHGRDGDLGSELLVHEEDSLGVESHKHPYEVVQRVVWRDHDCGAAAAHG